MSKGNLKEYPSVLLISEFSPPVGGMTVQAGLLVDLLRSNNYPISFIRTNPLLMKGLRWIDSIRVLRSVIKWLVFIISCRHIAKVDVVHIFSSSGLNYYLFSVFPLILSKLLRKKTVLNYHGGGAKKFFTRHPLLLKYSTKLVDEIVVPSEFLKVVFNDFGYKVKVVGNIVKVDSPSVATENNRYPAILSTRNFTPVYNIPCVLNAFHIVQKTYPNAHLLLAGDGPEKKALQEIVQTLNLNNVLFLGNMPNSKLIPYYYQSDVFINTSTVDNMPVSILEAFATGLPVVSTNVGGIPYLVQHRNSGLLANSDDSSQLAQHIVEILSNEELKKTLIKNGKVFMEELSEEKVLSKWLGVFSTLKNN